MHAPETRQRRRRAPYIIAATLVVLLAAGGVGGWAILARGEEKPAKLTLSGRLLIPGVIAADESCKASGYDDVRPGAQVTVTDETGRVIALGTLGAGLGGEVEHGQFVGVLCTFRFVVPDVPVARYYAVEVAHRGKVRFTRAQVDREVEITLGLG